MMNDNTQATQRAMTAVLLREDTLYQKLFKPSVRSVQRPPETNKVSVPDDSHRDIAAEVFSKLPDSVYLRSILSESVYARRGNILTFEQARHCNRVLTLPDKLHAPFEATDALGGIRVSQTIWVLYDDAGNCRLVTPTPSRGRMSIDGKIIDVVNRADDMPKDVVRGIQVILGCELQEGELRGCRWTHFAKEL